MRAPRNVCVGLIQNAIVLPTTEPFLKQKHAIMERVTSLIESAAKAGVNILCLQVAPCSLQSFRPVMQGKVLIECWRCDITCESMNIFFRLGMIINTLDCLMCSTAPFMILKLLVFCNRKPGQCPSVFVRVRSDGTNLLRVLKQGNQQNSCKDSRRGIIW